MRAFVIGSKNLSCAILEELLAQGHEVLGVFSRDHEPGMRIWHELGHKNLAEEAKKSGIPVYQNIGVNSPEAKLLLSSLNLDIILSCFWSEIFKEDVLNIPKLGVFNFHTAYLPLNRGSRPIPWAIIKGEKHCGITVHKMLTGIDNGPIVTQARIEITDQDTGLTLYNKVNEAGAVLAKNVIAQFAENTFKLTPQNEEIATYQPRGEPYGRQIDAFWDDAKKDRFIRAFTFPPFKGALAPPNNAIKAEPGVYFMFSTQTGHETEILDSAESFFSTTGCKLTVFSIPTTRKDGYVIDANLLGSALESLQFSLKKDPTSRQAMANLKASLEENKGIKGFRPGLTNSTGLDQAYRAMDLLQQKGVQFVSSKQLSMDQAQAIIPLQPHRLVNGLLEIPFIGLEGQNIDGIKSALNDLIEAAKIKLTMNNRDIYIAVSIGLNQIKQWLDNGMLKEDLEKKGVGFLSYSEVCAHYNAIYSEEK